MNRILFQQLTLLIISPNKNIRFIVTKINLLPIHPLRGTHYSNNLYSLNSQVSNKSNNKIPLPRDIQSNQLLKTKLNNNNYHPENNHPLNNNL